MSSSLGGSSFPPRAAPFLAVGRRPALSLGRHCPQLHLPPLLPSMAHDAQLPCRRLTRRRHRHRRGRAPLPQTTFSRPAHPTLIAAATPSPATARGPLPASCRGASATPYTSSCPSLPIRRGCPSRASASSLPDPRRRTTPPPPGRASRRRRPNPRPPLSTGLGSAPSDYVVPQATITRAAKLQRVVVCVGVPHGR